MPTRICFQLQVKPELLDEYLERHSPVWPEMLAEIAAAGRRNYSLFLGDGGRLIGYYETDDDAAAQAYLAASPVAARWEAEMAPLLRRPRGTTRPGRHARSPRCSTSKTSSPLPAATSIRDRRRKRRIVTTLSPEILQTLEGQGIELPSWAFGNSGTRFKVFTTPGTPRDPFEKIADAAEVNRVTALAPSVALHIPWDKVDSYDDLRTHAEDLGVALGTINSNTFQDDDYKFGALTHEDAAVRRKAIDHHLECIDIMDATGSRDLKIWLAEGSNYPGQADLRGRQDRLHESLQEIYARLTGEQRLVLEYKFFEPSFYHTDVPDWGTSYAQVAALGDRAMVCLDTGHHAPGHEHRVHRDAAAAPRQARLVRLQLALLRRRRPHRRRRRPVPAVPDPLRGHPRRRPQQPRRRLHARPVPQRREEDPRPDPLRAERAGDDRAGAASSTQDALRAAQVSGDVLAANAVLMDAFYTDVRPALAEWRESRGLPADPMAAFAASGYQEKIEADRVGGVQAGWGA